MKVATEKYESNLLSTILSKISPQEQAQTDRQMLLSIEIADAMKRKGLKKNDMARLMDVTPSVITKWLSGTFHFEPNLLMELERHLETRLINPCAGQTLL